MAPSFVRRDGSTERGDVVQVPQKRPRPVLSCVECRRKKLKCDRLLPCEQCRKAYQSAQCTYTTRPGLQSQNAHQTDNSRPEGGQMGRESAEHTESPAASHEIASSSLPADDTTPTRIVKKKVGVIEDLQSRVHHLERLLLNDQSRFSVSALEHGGNLVEQNNHSSLKNPGVLSVKGSRSRYHGLNHKMTLLHQFEGAKDYIQKSFSDLSMTAIVRELQLSQKFFARRAGTITGWPLHDDTSTTAKMLEILPSRSMCDKLVKIYMSNYENALRVLHIPTFLRECERFWATRDAQALEFASFIPQLTIVLAIASSLDDSDTIAGGASERVLSATACCDLVQAWLDGLRGKRRIELSTLRTQALVLLARQTSLTRVDELWSATGSLVRSAMTTGLHLDPVESPDISVFEGEQRRRLWMTIVELDLQTSLTCGMPAMIRQADFNCRSPANIDDVDLVEDMPDLLASKPLEEYTDSLSQVTLVRSLPLRLEAMSVGSSINLEADYGKTLELGRRLEEFLRNLPATLRFDYVSMEGNEGPGRLLGRVLLDVYIRRALLCLYRPFTLDASDGGTFAEVRRAGVRSSLIMLSHQDVFDPNVADLDVVHSKKYWDLFHVVCKNDIILAALSVCLEIKRMCHLPSAHPATLMKIAPEPQFAATQEERMSTWTKASLTRTVENILESLMRRLGEFGSDLKDPLCLSIVLQSVRTRNPQDQEALMREGVTSLIRFYRQRLPQGVRSLDGRDESGNVDLRSTGQPTSNAVLGATEDSTYQPGNQSDLLPPIGPDFLLNANVDAGELDFSSAIDWDFGQSWL